MISLASAADTCPTVTKEALEPRCSKSCANSDCRFVSTITNACGCPAAVPTATLLYPCGADCPYNGCGVEFRTLQQPCRVTTTSTTAKATTTTTRKKKKKAKKTTTTTTTTSTTSSRRVIVSITTLPPRPPPPPPTPTCPTVTKTTMPADCPVLRCPVPNCAVQENIVVPCGCEGPRTVLYVQGCRTECAAGCMTRTSTLQAPCATTAGPR